MKIEELETLPGYKLARVEFKKSFEKDPESGDTWRKGQTLNLARVCLTNEIDDLIEKGAI